ncbi:unnamed protein product [Candida verbasci]|uniref:Major facilitator superfamily (MFS) profile domain-containing protein n=1 Tax=Candida verbasci TaxID=1227364 RepID=A0A9W4TZS0_9ASCO|nr:unnamed protein product [Candida verbasci]
MSRSTSLDSKKDSLSITDHEAEYENALGKYTEEEVMELAREYAREHNLDEELLAKGAAVARSPLSFQNMDFLTEEEKDSLHIEATKKWYLSRKLLEVVALGSVSAAVQGMDQTVINGSTLFYPTTLGLTERPDGDILEGLINGAPYLAASTIACFLNDFCNRNFGGRRWVIFWTCVISAVTCIWQGVVSNHWWHLFISRFFLGFGVGIKSATVPAYSAECAPKHIRGALVMLWQFFTAVGIMFGYVASLAFYRVPDHGIPGLNWRLMLASAAIPAFIVLFQVPFVPESPRWLMGKGRHQEAFKSLQLLRKHDIAAARDCFYQYYLLSQEGTYKIPTYKRVYEMFAIRRNRNAALGAWIVMFMQQFCGINVIAYYSSTIFIQADFSEISALLASWGFGMINFTFAIPAFFTIDKFGRRVLLLITFPIMSIFLILTGCGFLVEDLQSRLTMVIVGIYLFSAVYSSGEGPVPFTYSAECFPLYIRDIGMSLATSTCWFFNFILAFTFPNMLNTFGTFWSFIYYAIWNLVGFMLVLLFLPETKGLSLEELDDVFSVSCVKHAKYQARNLINGLQRHILRMDKEPLPPLYNKRTRAPTFEEKASIFQDERL